MKWIEVTIITKSEAVEAITGIIHDMGLNVSIEDPKDILAEQTDWASTFKIDNLEQVIIKLYFPDEVSSLRKITNIRKKLNEISRYIDIGKGEIRLSKIRQEDWENNWKKYYNPVKVGERIVIKPSWKKYVSKGNEIIIDLDPGVAFGTGTHETTKMCIRFLEKFVNNGSTVLDIGCVSGILSICSSKLGALKVIGVDIDPLAVKASINNSSLNNLTNLEIRQGNLFDVVDEKFDVIVSNIIADVIIDITKKVRNYLNKEGVFICSGIIKDRLQDVKNALSGSRFEIIEEIYEGEWVAIASRLV